jgi:NTE family protein
MNVDERSSGGVRLPSPSIFDALDAEGRSALEREVGRLDIPAGSILFERGDTADALYLVLSGSLGVIIGEPTGGHELVNELYVGDTVGEMALLSERPRSATVVALRDTSLLRVTKEVFAKLIKTCPAAMLQLASQLVKRLERTTHRPEAIPAPRTLALIALEPTAPIVWLAAELARALTDLGATTLVLDEGTAEHSPEMLQSVETAHDLTLYRSGSRAPAWTETCIGRADRILFVTSAAPPPNGLIPSVPLVRNLPWRVADLVVVQEGAAHLPRSTPHPVPPLPVRVRHHVRERHRTDVERLARHILGRAVGIVFSGGGARGGAHIGVIRALRELGVPVDIVGGASFGSIVGAALACEWDDDELAARFRQAFVRSNPLNDYALPLVALTKGRKVSRLLRTHFGERRIEELWCPYFTVAANLTTGCLEVLREGSLWQALRASIALPGLLPPWVAGGQVLVDGAVMNNLPTDVMSSMRCGPIIACDLTRYETLRVTPPARPHRIWRLLTGQEFDGLSIVSTLMRSAHVGGDIQAKLSRDLADVLLEPPLHDVDLRDWRSFDRAVEAGYRCAMEGADEVQRLCRRPARI